MKWNFLTLRLKNLFYFTTPTSIFFLGNNLLTFFLEKNSFWNFLHFGKWNFLTAKLKSSYISLKKGFFIFWEMELSCSKFKKLQEGTFQAWKIKKESLWKYFLYFRKWNFLAQTLKNFYTFSKKIFIIILGDIKTKMSYIFSKKISIFNFRHLYFLHENFLYQNHQKKFLCC